MSGRVAAVGDMGALREIYVRRNRLRELPPSLAHLTALEALYLEDNCMTEAPHSFPPALAALRSMRGITLQRNALRALPPPILGWVQLQVRHNCPFILVLSTICCAHGP